MPAVVNIQMNVLGWVYEHQLGRTHFKKPIEMIVCVHFVHYDLEYTFLGHAVEDVEDVDNVDEQNQDQSDDIDKHLDEKEDLDRLDGQYNGMMIHNELMSRIRIRAMILISILMRRRTLIDWMVNIME